MLYESLGSPEQPGTFVWLRGLVVYSMPEVSVYSQRSVTLSTVGNYEISIKLCATSQAGHMTDIYLLSYKPNRRFAPLTKTIFQCKKSLDK